MKSIDKLILGSALRVIHMIIGVAIGLLLMPFIIHTLGDRFYGYWVLVSAIIGYYAILDLGIVSAIQYYVARYTGENNHEKINEIISTSFYCFVIIGIIVLILTFILAMTPGNWVDDPKEVAIFQTVIMIAGVGFAVGFPGRIFIGIISANLRFDLASIIGIVFLCFKSIGTVVLLLNGNGIVGLAAITVVSDLLMYYVYFVVTKKIQIEFKLSVQLAKYKTLKEIAKYSIFTLFTKTADQLRFYFHSIIVSGFIGLSAVTHYSLASQLTIHFLNLMIACMGMLSPYFSLLLGGRDNEGIVKSFVFSSKISTIISTIVAAFLILYGKSFLIVWMGQEYLDAYIPLVILTIGIFTDVAQLPSVSYLYGVARHYFLAYMTLAEGICNVLLSVFLVTKYGIVGVALGSALPMAIFKLCVQPIYVCKSLKISYRDYIIQTFFVNVLIVSAAIYVTWYFIFSNIASDNLFILGLVIFFHLSLLLPIVFIFRFNKEERYFIMNKATGILRIRSTSPV